MSGCEIVVLRRELDAVLAKLRAAESSASGQVLADSLKHRHIVHRQLAHDDVRLVGLLVSEGFFASKKTYPVPGVMELTGCRKSEAGHKVRLSAKLFSSATLSGQPVEPALPATAVAFAQWAIDQAHAVIIRSLLASAAAGRLSAGVWDAVEVKLAQWARLYRPEELATMGRQLIDDLDQDGPEPDYELDNQTNELHMTRSADGRGGRIKGHFDSATFDALTQVIEGLMKPHTDEGKSRPERQADAVGEMCERILDDGSYPTPVAKPPT
jgi:hypothetical protein